MPERPRKAPIIPNEKSLISRLSGALTGLGAEFRKTKGDVYQHGISDLTGTLPGGTSFHAEGKHHKGGLMSPAWSPATLRPVQFEYLRKHRECGALAILVVYLLSRKGIWMGPVLEPQGPLVKDLPDDEVIPATAKDMASMIRRRYEENRTDSRWTKAAWWIP